MSQEYSEVKHSKVLSKGIGTRQPTQEYAEVISEAVDTRQPIKTSITVTMNYKVVMSLREFDSLMQLLQWYKPLPSLRKVMRKELKVISNAYESYCKQRNDNGLPLEYEWHEYISNVVLTLTSQEYDAFSAMLLELTCLSRALSDLYYAVL